MQWLPDPAAVRVPVIVAGVRFGLGPDAISSNQVAPTTITTAAPNARLDLKQMKKGAGLITLAFQT